MQLLQETRDTNEGCIAELTNKLETERKELRSIQERITPYIVGNSSMNEAFSIKKRSFQREEEEKSSLLQQNEELKAKARQHAEQLSQLQAQLTMAQEQELASK